MAEDALYRSNKVGQFEKTSILWEKPLNLQIKKKLKKKKHNQKYSKSISFILNRSELLCHASTVKPEIIVVTLVNSGFHCKTKALQRKLLQTRELRKI